MKLSQAIQQTFLSAINKQIKDKHGSTPIVGMSIKGKKMTIVINEYNYHHATKILFSHKFKNLANKSGNYRYTTHHGSAHCDSDCKNCVKKNDGMARCFYLQELSTYINPIIKFSSLDTCEDEPSLKCFEIDMPTEVALGTLILNFINAKQD